MTEEERNEIIEEWDKMVRDEDKEANEFDEDLLYQDNGFASKKDFWDWKES